MAELSVHNDEVGPIRIGSASMKNAEYSYHYNPQNLLETSLAMSVNVSQVQCRDAVDYACQLNYVSDEGGMGFIYIFMNISQNLTVTGKFFLCFDNCLKMIVKDIFFTFLYDKYEDLLNKPNIS